MIVYLNSRTGETAALLVSVYRRFLNCRENEHVAASWGHVEHHGKWSQKPTFQTKTTSSAKYVLIYSIQKRPGNLSKSSPEMIKSVSSFFNAAAASVFW